MRQESLETWLEKGGRGRWTRKLLLGISAAALVLACGRGLPTRPTPLPTPQSSPSPVVSTFPGRLHVEGEKFVSPTGKAVTLLGGIVCCEGYPQNGWPLISEEFIRIYAENGGNFTHLRLGPFTAGGESPAFVAYEDAGDGRVDLSKWNEVFWQSLGQKLTYARSKGVYVELDLIDSWVLERPELHPWSRGNNINGVDEGNCSLISRPITPLQENWLRKIIEVTRGFDNVIYQVSNESFDCGRTLEDEWELSIIDFVHSLHGAALVGTNSHRNSIEDAADYVERHRSFVQIPRGKPMMVNEYGDDLTPENVRDEMRKGLLAGSSFHYWRGGHDDAQFSVTLAYLRAIREEVSAGN